MALTAAAAGAGAGAGVAAGLGLRWWPLVLWLASRLLDGLDGAAARRGGRQSDLGGYLDLMGDTLGYAAVPIGLAAAHGTTAGWAACAVLAASYYLNMTSWALLAAIAEKRGAGAAARDERTTIHMPAGLVEGVETIVAYTVMLALPSSAPALFVVMAALVGVTILQRVVWAWRSLR